MKINVVYNKFILNHEKTLDFLKSVLLTKNIDFKIFELEQLEYYGDFTFVIGGDGTILRAAKYYAEYDVPICGINIGRLGFLSKISVKDIDAILDNIIIGNYKTEERLMLQSNEHKALNDFVIKGSTSGRTSKFFLEINNKFVCDYIADGLIISSPTGSTAYGLSAGGPILHPQLNAIVIVPICPHTLNVRPLVIPVEESVTVKTGDEPLCVLVDGLQLNNTVREITICQSDKTAKLASIIQCDNFYSILRNKLHWGVAPDACSY